MVQLIIEEATSFEAFPPTTQHGVHHREVPAQQPSFDFPVGVIFAFCHSPCPGDQVVGDAAHGRDHDCDLS